MPRPPDSPGRPVRISGTHFWVGARRSADASSPRLMMAIPKKLLPSSPVRNLVRRVIREAWRSALLQRPGAFTQLSLRVTLHAVPQDPAAPKADPGGRALRPFARRPTDRALKRRVRAEVDGLLARLALRLA